MPKASQERAAYSEAEERVQITLELADPRTRLAVQIQTADSHVPGWAPRHTVQGLIAAMTEALHYSARVVRFNAPAVPRSHRVLIEKQGLWREREPMGGDDFKPLAP